MLQTVSFSRGVVGVATPQPPIRCYLIKKFPKKDSCIYLLRDTRHPVWETYRVALQMREGSPIVSIYDTLHKHKAVVLVEFLNTLLLPQLYALYVSDEEVKIVGGWDKSFDDEVPF